MKLSNIVKPQSRKADLDSTQVASTLRLVDRSYAQLKRDATGFSADFSKSLAAVVDGLAMLAGALGDAEAEKALEAAAKKVM